jgi:long-subunit fatty acid transport protein
VTVRIGLWLVLFFIPASAALADNSNRQILPLGESEAFLGNTGVGRATDTGGVYYNPAGLAELRANRVSVTGSVYVNITTQTDAIVHLDGADVPYKASAFNTIPATYAGAYRWDEWVVAFSVLVPSSIQVENRVPFTTLNTRSNLVHTTRISDLWIGLSAARRLNEQWNVGASFFGVQHQESNSTALDLQYPGSTSSKVTTSIQQMNLNVFGFSAVLGVSYQPTPWMSLGFRAQSPLLSVYGKADSFQSTHGVTGGVITNSGEDLQGTAASYQLPIDMTLGTAVSPWSTLTLLADVSLQVGSTYDSIPASTSNSHVDLKPTPRFNLGVEFKPTPTFPIRMGFFYNPSANAGSPGTVGFLQEDFYGVTAGIGLNSSRVETGIGAFLLQSTGQSTPFGADGTVSSLSTRAVGALLTASYLL